MPALLEGTAVSDSDGEGEGDPAVKMLLKGQSRLLAQVDAPQKRIDSPAHQRPGGDFGLANVRPLRPDEEKPNDVDDLLAVVDSHLATVDRDRKDPKEEKGKKKKNK